MGSAVNKSWAQYGPSSSFFIKGHLSATETPSKSSSTNCLRSLSILIHPKNYKIRTIGYDVFRLYFDTSEKDMQVGRQLIKRILK